MLLSGYQHSTRKTSREPIESPAHPVADVADEKLFLIKGFVLFDAVRVFGARLVGLVVFHRRPHFSTGRLDPFVVETVQSALGPPGVEKATLSRGRGFAEPLA